MDENRILFVDPKQNLNVLKGIASEIRIDILFLLQERSRNINELAQALSTAQSTIATNVMVLEKAGLVRTENIKGKKGVQKICHPVYREMVVKLRDEEALQTREDMIEVQMPIGLYTRYNVTAPCGLCSADNIIGYLDVPSSFLDPARMKAGLIWFETGYIEYKFPNNSLYKDRPVTGLELVAELSSEIPGTDKEWMSDINVSINGVTIGTWTSPGDYGDRRGKYTPSWWKLEGSQYGLLKNWRVSSAGSFIDGVQISNITLDDLHLSEHHSVTVRIGVKEKAEHVGGVNIFGRGFGNYDQDLVLRILF
jgi:predicted transcriptional regulator